MKVVIEPGRVTVDEIQYVPKSSLAGSAPWQLTDEHFNIAAQFTDPFDAILWAQETQAIPSELAAWCRTFTGEQYDKSIPARVTLHNAAEETARAKKSGKKLF